MGAPTEEEFRALSRSAPWRFTTLHFTHRRPTGETVETVEAWLRRPGRLLVLDAAGRRHVETGVPYVKGVLTSDGSRPGWTPTPPQSREPPRRGDGLVAERPDPFEVDYDDPMWLSYDWEAMLDFVELSSGTDLAGLAETTRHGRRTWWTQAHATEGYDPRCSCCPLLWGEVSERLLAGGSDAIPAADRAAITYPDAWLVGLDMQTGIVVSCEPLGGSRWDLGFTNDIHEVDAPMDDGLFSA